MTSSAAVSTALPPASKTVLSIVSQLEVPPGMTGLAEETEHRLVSGIAIGLLPVGQRLPSEEAMARTFSMAPLTFRRSLDRLRTRGLIVTRPGRGGGTTVTSIPKPEDVGAVADRNRAEASDLAVGLGALLGQCARLAAQRAEASDVELLTHLLGLVEGAEDGSQRRRAEMMLMVGLASVARSERLKSAAVPMIGKLQLLRWSIESDPAALDNESREFTSHLAAIIRAVGERDAAAAQHGAENTVMAVCDTIRLGSGESPRQIVAPGAGAIETGRSGVRRRFKEVTAKVEGIRLLLERAAQIVEGTPVRDIGRPRAERRLSEAFTAVIHAESLLVRGAGVAYSPAVLEDPPLWLDWWDSEDGDEIAFKPHAFSASSVQFYDYTLMPWFREPLRGGRFGTFGPYIDRGGVEQLTITAALPLMAGPLQGSVVGADLRPASIERLMLGSGESGPASVILTDRGRVVCSSVPGIVHGDLLDVECGRPALVDELTGWSLVFEE